MVKTIYIHLFFVFVICCVPGSGMLAQNIGINATGAATDSSAGLDIDFTNKGLLITQVALTATGDATTIPRPATGLLVYNLGTGGLSPAGYYYNSGTKAASAWVDFSTNNWKITGNSGMSKTTNFVGTTDSVALNFKVNNFKAGRIDPAGATFLGYKAGFNNNDRTNTGVGYKALYSVTDPDVGGLPGNGGANTAVGYKALYSNLSKYNTAFGYLALYSNTTGSYNTAVGDNALYTNTIGSYNTAVGSSALFSNVGGNYNTANGARALQSNMSGDGNTATGYYALFGNTIGSYNTACGDSVLFSNTTGSKNTAFGYRALRTNGTGSYNIAIGANADVTASNLNKSTAIGYNAKVGCSNCLVLGGTGADAIKVGIGTTTLRSTLSVAGGIAGKYREGNTISMTSTDLFIKLTGAGGSTLPAANSIAAGTVVIITNTTASAITLSSSGADTMCNNGFACGSTNVSIAAYTAVSYVSDGTSVWYGW